MIISSMSTSLLFIIYMIHQSLGIQYHVYGDGNQIYITFKPDQADFAIATVENTVEIIKTWMTMIKPRSS